MFDLRLQVEKYGQMAIQGQAGQRAAFAMACRLWRNSAESSEVLSAMSYYNSTKCVPQFSGAELNRIIDSAYKHTAAAGDVGKFRKSHHGQNEKVTVTHIEPSIRVTYRTAENPRITAAAATCHNRLMSGDSLSNRMIKNLAERGISKEAAAVFCLGLSLGELPKWLTIPLIDVNATLQGVMSKTFIDAPKYKLVGGACLFGAIHRLTAENVIMVEGQLDAILLWQYTSDATAVITVGSVNHGVDSDGLKWLQSKKRILIAMDNDSAGRVAAEKWRRLLPGATIATPYPTGSDATDVYTHGGAAAVKEWLGLTLDR